MQYFFGEDIGSNLPQMFSNGIAKTYKYNFFSISNVSVIFFLSLLYTENRKVWSTFTDSIMNFNVIFQGYTLCNNKSYEFIISIGFLLFKSNHLCRHDLLKIDIMIVIFYMQPHFTKISNYQRLMQMLSWFGIDKDVT